MSALMKIYLLNIEYYLMHKAKYRTAFIVLLKTL